MSQDTPANRSIFSGTPLRILIGLVLVVNGVFPALWILFTSLKTESELTLKPIRMRSGLPEKIELLAGVS